MVIHHHGKKPTIWEEYFGVIFTPPNIRKSNGKLVVWVSVLGFESEYF